MSKCLEWRVNDRHFLSPGVLSYAMIPRCCFNWRVFFFIVTSIVYAKHSRQKIACCPIASKCYLSLGTHADSWGDTLGRAPPAGVSKPARPPRTPRPAAAPSARPPRLPRPRDGVAGTADGSSEVRASTVLVLVLLLLPGTTASTIGRWASPNKAATRWRCQARRPAGVAWSTEGVGNASSMNWMLMKEEEEKMSQSKGMSRITMLPVYCPKRPDQNYLNAFSHKHVISQCQRL
jgi:hypothetical protein